MALDMWFKDDIQNVLVSVNQANGAAATLIADPKNAKEVRAYRQGFRDALQSVALSFGISLPSQRRIGDGEE